MKKRTRILPIILATVAAVAIAATGVPTVKTASANSAVRVYEGTTPSGVVVKDDKCPVEVKSEELLFSLPTVEPDDILAWRRADGAEYNNFVRATYTLFNPADYDVKVNLAFPFGNVPYYYDAEKFDDFTGYDITVNSETIKKQLRHTFIENGYYNYEYSPERDLARLRDDYVTDEFFNADTVVYKHECHVHLDVLGTERALMTLADLTFTADCMALAYETDGTWQTGLSVADGQEIDIYTFGENTADISPAVEFYEADGDSNDLADRKHTSGKLTVNSTEKLTADDLIYKDFKTDGAVSRMDWYNAVQDRIDCRWGTDTPRGYISYYMFELSESELMRWYEYDLNIAAGATAINSVTAPIYPDINEEYTPAKLSYTYLLSPALGWADFSDLEIKIVTPHYLLSSSFDRYDYSTDTFEYADGAYTAKFDKLPNGELYFTTCAEEEPSYNGSGAGAGIILAILLLFGYTLLSNVGTKLLVIILAFAGISVIGTIITAIVLIAKYTSKK